jgi:hypothetical protein
MTLGVGGRWDGKSPVVGCGVADVPKLQVAHIFDASQGCLKLKNAKINPTFSLDGAYLIIVCCYVVSHASHMG